MKRDTLKLLPPFASAGGDMARGADATREKLLAAAHELLVERGGGHVSVNDICGHAGANVAMVKYCFANKDGLFQALIDRITSGFIRDIECLDALALAAPEKLKRHVVGIVKNYVRYPYINRLINLQLLSADPDGVQHLANNFALPLRAWYGRLLKEGVARGEFRVIDPTLLFFTVLGMAEFYFTAQPLMRGAFARGKLSQSAIKRFIQHTTDMLLHGVLVPPPQRARARKSQ